MTRIRFGLSIFVAIAVCTGVVETRLAAQTTIAAAEARQIVLLAPTGSGAADREIANWQKRIAEKPANSPYWERLGWAYIAKARLTQDAGYYKLAELTATAWQAACGTNLDAQLLQGHVDHNLHRFKAAEAIARSLISQRKSPADYGLLSDSLMEQGQLEEAVTTCQTLCNLRPGVEAFTRIAHLRLLFGDLNGAVDAMESAIRAGDPRDVESRAWMYSRLAGYKLLAGQPQQALVCADKALAGAPHHPLALAMKGRALHSLGDNPNATLAFREAAVLNPIPDNQWWLADLLKTQGKPDEATAVEKLILRQGAATDPRTTALFLATREEKLDQATRLATDELQNRQDVFTHDAVAFAELRAGDAQAAAAETKLASARHTSDPRLALHAGLIAEALGDRGEATRCYIRANAMSALLTPSESELLAQHSTAHVAATP